MKINKHNRLVYQHFGLSEEDVKIVEEDRNIL